MLYETAYETLSPTSSDVSVYWVALGKELAQVALMSGGSDLVGTAFSENFLDFPENVFIVFYT